MLHNILKRFPAWGFTILCIAAILWLTLASKPLGDTEIPLFPGADKICHSIMFGGLVWCILLDWQRSHNRRPAKSIYIIAVCISALFGILTEWLQGLMQIGRSYDSLDSMADYAGALIFAILFIPLSAVIEKILNN